MKQYYGMGKAEQKDDAITNVLIAIFAIFLSILFGVLLGINV